MRTLEGAEGAQPAFHLPTEPYFDDPTGDEAPEVRRSSLERIDTILLDSLDMRKRLSAELDEAEKKAWDSLARYKFQMFGYWAAIWVHVNRLGGFKRPNPFSGLVAAARARG